MCLDPTSQLSVGNAADPVRLPEIGIDLDGSSAVPDGCARPAQLQQQFRPLRQHQRRGAAAGEDLVIPLQRLLEVAILRRADGLVFPPGQLLALCLRGLLVDVAPRRQRLLLLGHEVEILIGLGVRAAGIGLGVVPILRGLSLRFPLGRRGISSSGRAIGPCLGQYSCLDLQSDLGGSLGRLLGPLRRLPVVVRVRLPEPLPDFDLDELRQVARDACDARLVYQVESIPGLQPPKQAHGLRVERQAAHLGLKLLRLIHVREAA
mmetsp:Transcript_95380/g.273514  ORF Transcript_95380/g.273514 Transcript_95380/m.273514 type:complete len:263 (-) Transcript_95380:1356-2144(-)